MTAVIQSFNNYYLFGDVTINLEDYFDTETKTAVIPIAYLLYVEAQDYPVPDATTRTILYKSAQYLYIPSVYQNTPVYRGISNTYPIGSFNYSFNGYMRERQYINYLMQDCGEISAFVPSYGSYGDTTIYQESLGVPNPSQNNCIDAMQIYLENADINGCELTMQYSIQQITSDSIEEGVQWNSLSNHF